ncbi:glycosyltransferase family 39 protein [Oligoflexia bacterium]|nr:glycosyltransferase family 39 protein [Oligoflexia bacterium]
MNKVPSILRLITGGVFSLIGVFLLLFFVPHNSQFELRCLKSIARSNQLLLQCGPWSGLHFSYTTLLGLMAILFALVLMLHPLCRALFARIMRHKTYALTFQLSFILLLITLATPNRDNTPVLYLVAGTLGVLSLLLGFERLDGVFAAQSLRARLEHHWQSLRSVLFSSSPTAFILTLFSAAFILNNLCSYFLFEHLPTILDSTSQYLHSKILLSGKLVGVTPPLPEFFNNSQFIADGSRWYSQFPPGHTVALALGFVLGVPWLVNPLLGALTVILVYLVGREVYDERTGRLGGLLTLASPFVLLYSSEFMNHATAFFFFMLFLLFYFRTLRHQAVISGLLSGIFIGYVALTRPLTAFGLVLPFLVYALVLCWRSPKQHLKAQAAVAVGALIMLALFGLFNYYTNGSPFVSGYEVLQGPGHNPGFGTNPHGSQHTIGIGIGNTLDQLTLLNKYLFEWPLPALLFVVILVALIPKLTADRLLLCSFGGLVFAYALHWYHENFFGPRYYYEASGILALLTVRGVAELLAIFKTRMGVKRLDKLLTFGFVVCLVCAAIGQVPQLLAYNRNMWKLHGDVINTVKAANISNAVVFVNSGFQSAFTQNTPTYDGSVLYSRALPHRTMLMGHYPNRSYFVEKDGLLIPLEPELPTKQPLATVQPSSTLE